MGIKERLEAACAEAGLDPALRHGIVERVLAPDGAGATAGDGAGGGDPGEAELTRIREETRRMAANEAEMMGLLRVTSREAIVPALEAVLQRVRTLKAAAGFDPPPSR